MSPEVTNSNYPMDWCHWHRTTLDKCEMHHTLPPRFDFGTGHALAELKEENAALRAEFERLRAGLTSAQSVSDSYHRTANHWMDKAVQAEARLERVVEAAKVFASPLDAPLCDRPDCKVCALRRALASAQPEEGR